MANPIERSNTAPSSNPTERPTKLWEQIGKVVEQGTQKLADKFSQLLGTAEFNEGQIKSFVETELVDNFGVAFRFEQKYVNGNGERIWVPVAYGLPFDGAVSQEVKKQVDNMNKMIAEKLKPGGTDRRDPNYFTLKFIEALGTAKPKDIPDFQGTDVDRQSLLVLARNERLQNLFLKRAGAGAGTAQPDMQQFVETMKKWGNQIPMDGYTQTLLNAQKSFAAKNASAQGMSETEKKIHEELSLGSKERMAYYKTILESSQSDSKKRLAELDKQIKKSLGLKSSDLQGARKPGDSLIMDSADEIMNSDTPLQDLLDRLGRGVKSMNSLEFAALLFGGVYLLMTADEKTKKALFLGAGALVLAKPASSLLLNKPMGLLESGDALIHEAKGTSKYFSNIEGYLSSLPGPLKEFFQKNPEFGNGMMAMSHLNVSDMRDIMLGSRDEDIPTRVVDILETKLKDSGLERHQIEAWMKNIGFSDGARIRGFMEEITLGAAGVGHISRDRMTPEQKKQHLLNGLANMERDYSKDESVISVIIMQAAKGELRNFNIELGERLTPTTPGATPPSAPGAAPSGAAAPAAAPVAAAATTVPSATPSSAPAASTAPARGAESASHRTAPTMDRLTSAGFTNEAGSLFIGKEQVQTGFRATVNGASLPLLMVGNTYYADVTGPRTGVLDMNKQSVTIRPLGEFINKVPASVPADRLALFAGKKVSFDADSNRFYGRLASNPNLGDVVFYYDPQRKEFFMEKVGTYGVLGANVPAELTKNNIEGAMQYATIVAALEAQISTTWRLEQIGKTMVFKTELNGMPMKVRLNNGKVEYQMDHENQTVWKPITQLEASHSASAENFQEKQEDQERFREANERRREQVQKIISYLNGFGFGFETRPMTQSEGTAAQNQVEGNRSSMWIQSPALGYLGLRLDFFPFNKDNTDPNTAADQLKQLGLGNGKTAVNSEVTGSETLETKVYRGFVDVMNKYYFEKNTRGARVRIKSLDGEGVTNALNKGTVTLEVSRDGKMVEYKNFPLTNLPLSSEMLNAQDPNQPNVLSEDRRREAQRRKEAYFEALPRMLGVTPPGEVLDVQFGKEGADDGKYIYVMAYDAKAQLRVTYKYELAAKLFRDADGKAVQGPEQSDDLEYRFVGYVLGEAQTKKKFLPNVDAKDIEPPSMAVLAEKQEQSLDKQMGLSKRKLDEAFASTSWTLDGFHEQWNSSYEDLVARDLMERMSEQTDTTFEQFTAAYGEKMTQLEGHRRLSKPEAPMNTREGFNQWLQYHIENAFMKDEWSFGMGTKVDGWLPNFLPGWLGGGKHNLPAEIVEKVQNHRLSERNFSKYFYLLNNFMGTHGEEMRSQYKYHLKDTPTIGPFMNSLVRLSDSTLDRVDTTFELDTLYRIMQNPNLPSKPGDRAKVIDGIMTAVDGYQDFLANPLDGEARNKVLNLFDGRYWLWVIPAPGSGTATGGITQTVENAAIMGSQEFTELMDSVGRTRLMGGLALETQKKALLDEHLQTALSSGSVADMRAVMVNRIQQIFSKLDVSTQEVDGVEVRSAYRRWKSTATLQEAADEGSEE